MDTSQSYAGIAFWETGRKKLQMYWTLPVMKSESEWEFKRKINISKEIMGKIQAFIDFTLIPKYLEKGRNACRSGYTGLKVCIFPLSFSISPFSLFLLYFFISFSFLFFVLLKINLMGKHKKMLKTWERPLKIMELKKGHAAKDMMEKIESFFNIVTFSNQFPKKLCQHNSGKCLLQVLEV